MEIALVQLRTEAGDVGRNVGRAVTAIEAAAVDGADLVVLPELFTVGYFAFDSYARRAEPLDGPTLSRLADVAVDQGVAILAGSIVEDLAGSAAAGYDVPETEGLANTSVFLDRSGAQRAVYRKRHLFGYGSRETELLVSGELLPLVSFEGFEVGMTTCYDLRFPEQFRTLADRGATLVCVPCAWPYPQVEHWELLPRARAVENLMYVATANGVGTIAEHTLLGRSTVYDPWGHRLASTGDEPATVRTTIDPDRVERIRGEFPAFADRRLGE